jgi:hypothetical protein
MNGTSPSQPWGIPAANGFFSANETPAWPFEISTLQTEKEILEDGLADCVTYLQVLRKKQARIERRLVTDPSLPRKKRKKIQQGKRELEKEIRHRERDEQAFLNNLQVCKANIYIAETVSLPSTTISSTLPDFASISTRYSYPRDLESAPTEMSWNGWADETALSPFQKESNHHFFAVNVAPEDECKQSLAVQHIRDIDSVPCASPNTLPHSLRSPEAPVFQLQSRCADQEGTLDQQLARLDLLSSMATTASRTGSVELLDRRLVSDAGIGQTQRQSSLDKMDEEVGTQTLADSSSTNRVARGGKLRCRTNSL